MKEENTIEQEVLIAGNALENDGKRVTAWGLRRILDGGTPSTLLKIWNSSKENKEPFEEEKSQLTLPVPIQDNVDKFINEITTSLNSVVQRSYRAISDVAEEKLEAVQELSDKRNLILKDELATAEKLIESSDLKITKLNADLESTNETIQNCREDKSKLLELSAILNGKNELLDERELLIKEKDIKYYKLENEFDTLQNKYLELLNTGVHNGLDSSKHEYLNC